MLFVNKRLIDFDDKENADTKKVLEGLARMKKEFGDIPQLTFKYDDNLFSYAKNESGQRIKISPKSWDILLEATTVDSVNGRQVWQYSTYSTLDQKGNHVPSQRRLPFKGHLTVIDPELMFFLGCIYSGTSNGLSKVKTHPHIKIFLPAKEAESRIANMKLKSKFEYMVTEGMSDDQLRLMASLYNIDDSSNITIDEIRDNLINIISNAIRMNPSNVSFVYESFINDVEGAEASDLSRLVQKAKEKQVIKLITNGDKPKGWYFVGANGETVEMLFPVNGNKNALKELITFLENDQLKVNMIKELIG